MATSRNRREGLARSLEALRGAERNGVVRAAALVRTDRERLLRAGFLREVVKGWLLVSDPAQPEGSSAIWYASFWSFVTAYLDERFGDGYCLSAESSLLRHTESVTIPRQVTVMTKGGSNQVVALPFDTSLLLYRTRTDLPGAREKRDGLWVMELGEALARVSLGFFRSAPQDAEIALRKAAEPSHALRALLEAGNATAAGRLAGAYAFLGREDMRERIVSAMRAAGHTVRVVNPFEREAPALRTAARVTSPQAARIAALWAAMRDQAARLFPDPPGLPADAGRYLEQVEERYLSDAYNSLSIEGYRVTPELIERVRKGRWDPLASAEDSREQDAMAARGYFLAFQEVKRSVAEALAGGPTAEIVDRDHARWYQAMFSPAVTAGLLPASALAGYRSTPVYLRGSRHVPPASHAVLDCLDAFFESLREEEHPGVRAVLGHFLFVYVHPYPDGNGRIGRFLMNVLLAGGGYPWTVIRHARRGPYLAALEAASTNHEIGPFTQFVREEMEQGEWSTDSNT